MALDGLDHSAGTQIAAADAGHHQHIGVLTDLGRCFLDAGELFLIVIAGQIHPAQEVIAGAVLGFQLLVCGLHLRVDGLAYSSSLIKLERCFVFRATLILL